MDQDPVINKIDKHIRILYKNQREIEERVQYLFPVKSKEKAIDDVFNFCSDFDAIRSIGYLAAMKEQERRNILLLLTENNKDIIDFIKWLMITLMKNNFIFAALQHVLPSYFTERNIEIPELKPTKYDVFISYASEDIKFATILAERLRDEGVKVWFDKWQIKTGHRLSEKINEGIEHSIKMISVWSPDYFKQSKTWTKIELFSMTHDDMLAEDRPVIPVLLKECKDSIKPTLKDYIFIDFTNPDDFEIKFRALLNDLDLDLEVERLDRQVIKKEALYRGKNFKNEVENLYILLGFSAKQNIKINGNNIDLLIEQKLGGRLFKIVVECKTTRISSKEKDQILSLQNIVQKTEPFFQWIAISPKGFTTEARNALETSGVSCVTYKELLGELVPIEPYLIELKKEYETWVMENWKGQDFFIRPDILKDIEYKEEKALTFFSKWMGNPDRNFLVILGDLGTGKTSLLRFLSFQLAAQYLDDPVRHPAPVIIPLKDVRKEVSLSGIIYRHFETYNVDVNFKKFFHLLKIGKIILFFDAFDEMADRIQWDITRSNFNEFQQAAVGKAKVILTCRTHYFRDRTEQVSIIGEGPLLSDLETDLYRELQKNSGAEVVYLQEFDDEKITQYLKK
ncbi:MAG: hypothetical protein OMM_03922 [Candidatus Magnetoglobus multicellularis str. Araruama]|uniref:TIR domain-containing protein n=1 Tax=Candidatus Magnetoglobus multicellularis str. Araruama TaxID=890399 RepID=A0A1V1P3J2_9BACT|nr:MAG: hypothetical protein OMM_03922 [Candidatus Magnetoglobus multicellularis str. Araruama]